MARRHLKSPSHYLIDPYTWPWSPNGHRHGLEWPTPHLPPPLFNVNWPCHSEIQLFPIWWWKSLVKAMHVVKGQGHIWPWKFKVKVMAKVTWPSVTFDALSSIDMFAFISWQSDHFWLKYSKFHIWPWKIKVKVMAKTKPDGLDGLEFNQYICFLFRGNGTIFGWDITNLLFDIENSRSRSQRKLTKI